MFLSYLLAHENINIHIEDQLIFNYLCMRQLWNTLSEDQSVLSIGSTKSVPNSPFFLKILKGILFPERSKYNFTQFFRLIITHMPKYTGKVTNVHFRPWATIICSYWNCTTKMNFCIKPFKKRIPVITLNISDHFI